MGPRLHKLLNNFLTAWRSPRWRWALLIALLSDALGFGFVLMPPVRWLLDAVTAAVLFGVLGFRWMLLSALVIEVIPVLQVFPAWILFVIALASSDPKISSERTVEIEQDAGSVQK